MYVHHKMRKRLEMLRLNNTSLIDNALYWKLPKKEGNAYRKTFIDKKTATHVQIFPLKETMSRINVNPKIDLRWLEKWDQSSLLLENADLANSQASANIPMVDFAVSPSLHLSLSLSYTSSDLSTNGPLGNGWTLHNTQEYIVLDHKQSVFSDNHIYQLFVEGQQSPMARVANQTNTFYIDGEDDMTIKFQESNQRWIVETSNAKSVYGNPESGSPNSAAHQWSLTWEHWRGPGRSESGMKKEILAWYLVSREEKHGAKRKIYYSYQIEEKTTPAGNSYTSAILLKRITDSTTTYSLELDYTAKSAAEFIDKNMINVDGNIQFPIPLALKYFLTGYTLISPSFQQVIQFRYSTQDKSRTLTSIEQVYSMEPSSPVETIFEFLYDQHPGGKFIMNQISIPSYNSTVHFEYSKLEIPLLRFGKDSLNTLRYPAVDNIQITQGEDFGIMAFDIGTGGVFLRMFNKQLTRYSKDLYTCPQGMFRRSTDPTILYEDPLDIEKFAVMLYPDLIAVLEDKKDEKRLNLFHRKNDTMEWPDCPDKTISLPKHSLFRYSDKIMVIAKNVKNDTNRVTIIHPIANGDTEQESDAGFEITDIPLVNNLNRNITRMVVHDSRIFAYNEFILIGIKQLEDNTWKEYEIRSVASGHKQFFDNFRMEEEIKEQLSDQITLNGLHVVDNMVLLTTVDHYAIWLFHLVSANMHVYLIDENFAIQREHKQLVEQQDLLQITDTQELDDKSELTFKYHIVDDFYEGYLYDISGPLYEDACKDASNKDECKKEVIKEIMKNSKDDFAKMVIFDPESFMTYQLDQYGARTKKNKLNMLGNSWQWTDLPTVTNMRLSAGYVMQSTEDKNNSATSYVLYRQNPATGGPTGRELERFVIDNYGNMAIGFPSYLAMQPDFRNQPELRLFREEGEDVPRIPLGDRDEQILRMCNHEILVTIINSTDPSLAPFDKEVLVRRVNSVVPSTPMWVLSKTKVQYGDESRVRAYVNTFSRNDTTIAQANSIQVIPTGNTTYAGWYEEHTIIPVEEPRNSTKTQNWYDSSGELVSSKEVKPNSDEYDKQADEDEAASKSYKLWDASGQLEIADISPYNATDNMVAYFGFEDYERNIFEFDHPVLGILQNEFPFTGEKLLRLRPVDNITASITPAHQRSSFIVSSWVRPHGNVIPFRYDTPVAYFKANLRTHTGIHVVGFHGQMKRQMENWLYLEIAVDLDKVRSNVYSEIYRMSGPKTDLPVPLNTNFTIQIHIDSAGHNFMDVDHIRFAPANLDFTVSVYNSKSAVETAMIQANGGILRKIHDHSGIEMASVDEDGTIEQFKTGTKSSTTFPTPQAEGRPALQFFRKEVIIIPEEGSYQSFDKYSLSDKWTLEDADTSWQVSNAKLLHVSSDEHKLTALYPEVLFDPESSAIRFYMKRLSPDATLAISLNGYDKLVTFNEDNTVDVGYNCRHISNLPSSGEIVLYVEKQSIFVWFNGMLLADRKLSRGCLPSQSYPNDKPWSHFHINASGMLEISQLFSLTQPQVTVEYQNAWGDRTQVVQIEDSNTALITETIYDELGRDAIKTKTSRVRREEDYSSILGYYDDYVSNRNPDHETSIFKTGIANGLLSELNPLDEGYPYSRSIFHDDMLREVKIESMPGKAYSIDGSFTKQHGRKSGLVFLKILFPPENGFHEKVTYEPSGSIKVMVLDNKENEVAEYVKVAGYDNILSINEYDEEGNLLKLVPPMYHQKMNTFMNRNIPWNFGEENLTEEERFWQDKLCTHYRYDNKSQMVWKKTPDLKAKGYIYDKMGNVRFMHNLKSSNESAGLIDDEAYEIIYLVNIGRGKPAEIGYVSEMVPVVKLKAQENSTAAVGTSYKYQKVAYSDTHADPELRGKLKLFLTYDDHTDDPSMAGVQPPHQEILKFNTANNVVMRTSNAVHSGSFTNYIKHYQGGKLRELQHPPETDSQSRQNSTGLNLIYTHDKMGRLVSLGTRANPQEFVHFSYNAAGQVQTETTEPDTEYPITRQYEYDSPGLLNKIVDPYLSQMVSFIDGGYGQSGFGDGIITTNIFNSTWSAISNLDALQKEWFRLPTEDFDGDKLMNMCFTAMQRLGYLDEETLIPLRFLTHSMLSNLPLPCGGSTGHTLMKIVAKYLPMTSHYGHNYAYGNHRELVKAKFFGDEQPESINSPLQVNSFFSEIEEIDDILIAKTIWEKLVEGRFLIVDNGNPDDVYAAVGKEGGSSIFRYTELQNDLKEVDENAGTFAVPIMRVLYNRLFSTAGPISLDAFQDIYVEWHGYLDMETPLIIINRAKEAAAKIFTMLTSKGYVTAELTEIMHPTFVALLEPYSEILDKITQVLLTHFKSQIGLNVFDYESYRIDPNGNHQMFYIGFNRHQLSYTEDTNQVNELSVQDPYALPGEDETVTELEHDTQGNVSKAPHRGVQKIKYHPVINRPTFMELTDGRRITIKYDAQGERLLKRVFRPSMKLMSEVKYLRDEHGAVLMDKRSTFDEEGKKEKETTSTYLYGPRKTIVGFIRNGKFYSVFTDHAGSIRLILHKGRVVAGYDYWPYGELMKEFGEEDAHVMYRFTGQEYDPETGLYNYHARIYDPTVGRFFQPDPKSQYFSPYVYGGNSPVSLVDPDGEFFFLLFCIIGAIVGAYLAAAAANGSFNPLKWDWKSGKTWMALLGGGIGGAMLPGSFLALAGTSTIGIIATTLVGIAGAYIKGAIQNGSWNPGDWNWADPATYNAFMEGFSAGISAGSGLKSSFKELQKFANTFSKLGQKILVYGSAAVAGAGLALVKGAMVNNKNFKFWEWDFKNPETFSAIIDGFNMGMGVPMKGHDMYKNFAKLRKNGNFKKMLTDLKGSAKHFFKTALKDKKHPLYKKLGQAVIAYTMVSIESGTIDFTKWEWKSRSTYEGILNGWKTGPDIVDMHRSYYDNVGNFVDSVEKYQDELIKLQEMIEATLELIASIQDIMEFYMNLPEMFTPGNGDNSRMIPIAAKMFANIATTAKNSLQKSSKFDNLEFQQLLQQLLSGLNAGSFVTPTANSAIERFVDCFQPAQNGTSEPFQICNIGKSNSITFMRNRELVNQLFTPTNLYQSKTEFLPIPSSDDPKEFLDHLLKMFRMEVPSKILDEAFISSLFTGSVYNSLLNRPIDVSSTTLFFRSYELPALQVNILHVGQLLEQDERKILSVRSILLVSPDKFTAIKNDLADTLTQLKYDCYLPSNLISEVDEISAETLVIETDTDNFQMHVLTPDYSKSSGDCSGYPQKFYSIPTPTRPVYDHFRNIQNGTATIAEKLQKYENFLTDVVTDFNEMSSLPSTLTTCNSCLTGFIYGLLSFNMKNTFDLTLQLPSSTDPADLLVVAKRDTFGYRNFQGTPTIIRVGSAEAVTESSLHYQSALLSLSKNVMVGTISPEEVVHVSQQDLPEYQGIFSVIFDRKLPQFTSLMRYLYHSNHFSGLPISPDSQNLHFISNFLLGEFLSHMEDDSLEIFAFAPSSAGDQERLTAQRAFFIRNKENSRCTFLNIIESSTYVDEKFEFDPNVDMDIPSVPDVEIKFLQMYDLQVNINSGSTWDLEEAEVGMTQQHVFFQDAYVQTIRADTIPRDNSDYFKLEMPTSFARDLNRINFSKDYITKMFQMLKENRLHLLLNTDQDFRSVFMGLLSGATSQVQPDVDGISVALQKFEAWKDALSQKPLALSLVSMNKNGTVIPQTDQVLLANLKTSVIGGEQDVQEKMKVAKEELKQFYCSREDRLKEAFRITQLPAVYSTADDHTPEMGDRVTFEVDPRDLTGVNCSAPENPFQKFLRKPEENENAPNSGYFGGFYNFMKQFSERFYGTAEKPMRTIPNDVNVDGCHLGAWNDGQYSVDGITCSSGKSKIAVFRNIQPNDLVTVTSRGQPFSLVGDSYTKGSCSPVTFNGKPSVVCEGDKTTLIYTPLYEQKIFDELDGTIMLGRMALHLGGNLWKFIRQGGWKKEGTRGGVHIVPEEMMSDWEKEILTIKEIMGKWEGSTDHVAWAARQVDECFEMMEEIKTSDFKVQAETIEEITERLGALQEDLAEQILYAKTGKLFDQANGENRDSKQEETYFGNGNFYNGYGMDMGGNNGSMGAGSNFNHGMNGNNL